MGNYKFRLSDMMPNAWFYKLKDMGRASRKQGLSHRAKKTHHQRVGEPTTPKSFPSPHPPSSKQTFLPNRASYYYPRRTETEKLSSSPIHPKASNTHFLIDPPRKSKRRSRRKLSKPSTKLVTTSVCDGCNCRVLRTESSPVYTVTTPLESPPCHNPDYTKDEDDDPHKPFIADLDGIKSWITSSPTDIIIDMCSKSDINMAFAREIEKLKDFDTVSEIELPPILTKPVKKEAEPANFDEKGSYPNVIKSPARKSPAGLHRLRMRASSPRLATKKTQANRARRSFGSAAAATKQRKGISESFAIVKSSSDPQRDFRDSMVEMIVENNIRASKDLEELLACYLTLNSNEYHDVIVKVFEQIWFDLTDIIRL